MRRARVRPAVLAARVLTPLRGRPASVLSVGGFRQQFSNPECVAMSLFSAQFAAQAQQLLHVPGCDHDELDVQWRDNGYLFVSSTEAGAETLRRNHAMQVSLGASNELLSADDVARRFPWLRSDDVALACLGTANEGWLDPWSLLRGVRRKAIHMGVTFVDAHVTGMELEGSRVHRVATTEHELECGAVVNAAGAYSGRLAAMYGIDDWPVVPRRRCVFVFHVPGGDFPRCPLVVDKSGVYFRREGADDTCTFLAGVSPDAANDPDCSGTDELVVDQWWHSLWEERMWPALAERVPAFESLKVTGSWAGFYDYNKWDQNALMGLHPACDNVYHATGFSGHGLQQAAAAGRAVAELVTAGAYRSLDLSRLSAGRYLAGDKVEEENIV